MDQTTAAAEGTSAGVGDGGKPGSRMGGRHVDISQITSRLSRTFVCVGPVCLRSGIGPGVGVGCGVGIIKGPMVPLGSEGNGLDFLRQIPGGYQIMNILRSVMRRFPGSRVGVGCGVGVGFGFGIGLAPAGSAGGRLGMMGGSMGGGMGMGGMGGLGGGHGSAYGQQGYGGYGAAVPSGQTSTSQGQGVPVEKVQALEDRVRSIEEKMGQLEDRVNVSLRMRDLEERVSQVEQRKRR